MSRHLNRVTLIGVIGAAPTLDASAGQTAACKFSVGITEQWKGKFGKSETRTEWHRVVVLGKQAEFLFPILGAGKRVYLEGPLTTREIVIHNTPVTVSRIKADRVIVLGHDRDVEKDAELEEARWCQSVSKTS